ncbi:conjugal transfer protein TraD [Flavobacterium anhuiense]|uniref:conjugal transfer protein TraD n=1 Tax=Flavobacterium anhuiense TaxID=459526 RepID=UPI000E6D23CD|nr:conjugal transfer protein TraD [Flavobacterium anhuiense]
MENLIVIFLLLIIALLLRDKIPTAKSQKKKPAQQKKRPKLPDIMGKSKPLRSLLMPKRTAESPDKNGKAQRANFDIEIIEDSQMQKVSEELDDVFKNEADLKQEQQEWNSYGNSISDDGLAQGVTLEELSAVEMLLQKNKLEPSEKKTAITLVHKIQGTELFSLLENSIESASRKITALLDESLSSEKRDGLMNLQKDDLNDFNIGDFV